jgi:DNA-binding NarL/FixJ family response regulator
MNQPNDSSRLDSRPVKIRVLVAEDHPLIRSSLAELVRLQSDLALVGEACDGREAVEGARRLEPDVVIMDVTMPEMNGWDATRIIVSERPWIRVIAYSMHDDEDAGQAMREAGAVGYVIKGGPIGELLATVRGCVTSQHRPE